MKRNIFLSVVSIFLIITFSDISAHCDSMDGPVVKASQKALDRKSVV